MPQIDDRQQTTTLYADKCVGGIVINIALQERWRRMLMSLFCTWWNALIKVFFDMRDYSKNPTQTAIYARDAVVETKVLVSRRLVDKNSFGLGLEKSISFTSLDICTGWAKLSRYISNHQLSLSFF